MPDAGDAPAPAAAAHVLHASAADASPDRVGEELADDAHIWRVYDRVAKEDDDRRIASWNRGLDNLALFAGLFSAVTTAFIIEAQNDMKPDYAQLTFRALNASAFDQPFIPEPFVIPSGARSVNCLWVSSLLLSLSAALIAIMGKDWIGMYASRPVCNPRQWAEMRTYRLRCVERWYMSGVIAAAPVLLHVSLLLFGAGLVGFMSTDPVTQRLTLVLCLFAGILYVATALSAILFPGSPFKSPASQMIRAALPELLLFLRVAFSAPKRNALFTLQSAINEVVAPGLVSEGRHQRRSLRDRLARSFWDAGLPGPESRRLRSPGSLLRSSCTSVVSFLRSLWSLPRVCMDEFRYRRQRPHAKPYWAFLASCRDLRVKQAFIGSTWTEISVDRRLTNLSDALLWLSDASQAPDVRRGLVFALGDLEVGQQVGQLASSDLCARIRAEIRHGWRKADYATLSRYVLADRNLPQGPFLQPDQFFTRYDVEKNPTLRCEHGLAASVLLGTLDTRTVHFDMISCFPDQLSQPRMAEFLLPHIAQFNYRTGLPIFLLLNRYWPSLREDRKFILEIELYRRLGQSERSGYADWVQNACRGRPGPIELLTLASLHLHGRAEKETVELVLQVLDSIPKRGGHSCLAYLFRNLRLEPAVWGDGRWPTEWNYRLGRALIPSFRHSLEVSDDSHPGSHLPWGFALALARTAAMLFSPTWPDIDPFCFTLRYLIRQLRGRRSLLDDREKDELVGLLLHRATLSAVFFTSRFRREECVRCGFAILVAITSSVARRLDNSDSFDDGVQLFGVTAVPHEEGIK